MGARTGVLVPSACQHVCCGSLNPAAKLQHICCGSPNPATGLHDALKELDLPLRVCEVTNGQ
eukprot:5490758-Karenia_brevis.AAC.1